MPERSWRARSLLRRNNQRWLVGYRKADGPDTNFHWHPSMGPLQTGYDQLSTTTATGGNVTYVSFNRGEL